MPPKKPLKPRAPKQPVEPGLEEFHRFNRSLNSATEKVDAVVRRNMRAELLWMLQKTPRKRAEIARLAQSMGFKIEKKANQWVLLDQGRVAVSEKDWKRLLAMRSSVKKRSPWQ